MDAAGSTETRRSHGACKNGSWFSQFRNGSNPWMARYVYGLLFLISNVLAWGVRDYGHSALKEMKKLKSCEGGRQCLGAEGVLRVSLGCFTFYFIMFLSTVRTREMLEPRDRWHSGWWSVKLLLWSSLNVITFFMPSPMIQIYGDLAHFGAGIFLLVQLISVISFITWLNDCCHSETNEERCRINVMIVSTMAYLLSLMGIVLLYIWYAPEPICLLNIFFITWTLFLLQLMTSVSIHPKINAGFLTPGLMGLYIVFICWCAIRSEPANEKCNRKAEASQGTDWLTIMSFVIALLAMVFATFSTGIDSQCFKFNKTENRAEDAIPYGYGFFHLVFATGAMYFAMLLIGWNSHHPMRKWTIDVGWTSTWVRIVNEWIAVCVYVWMVVAPVLLKNRRASEQT